MDLKVSWKRRIPSNPSARPVSIDPNKLIYFQSDHFGPPKNHISHSYSAIKTLNTIPLPQLAVTLTSNQISPNSNLPKMFNLKGSASKSAQKTPTDDQASTYSSTTTLTRDDASEYTLKPNEPQKKEKTSILSKLGMKKNEFVANMPIGRSNEYQKELKESGKKVYFHTPTVPLIYVWQGKF
jgi:hypothetical protein